MIGGEHSPWMERMPRCGGCLLTGLSFFFAVWRSRSGRDGFPAETRRIWELPTIGEHGRIFQGTVFFDSLRRIIRGKAVFSDVHQRMACRLWERMKSLLY